MVSVKSKRVMGLRYVQRELSLDDFLANCEVSVHLHVSVFHSFKQSSLYEHEKEACDGITITEFTM